MNNLSLHPTSPRIPRIIQPFRGVGEEFGAGVLQVEEFAVGAVVAADNEGAALVSGDVEAFAGTGEQFVAIGKQVAEGSVAAAVVAYCPRATAIL